MMEERRTAEGSYALIDIINLVNNKSRTSLESMSDMTTSINKRTLSSSDSEQQQPPPRVVDEITKEAANISHWLDVSATMRLQLDNNRTDSIEECLIPGELN